MFFSDYKKAFDILSSVEDMSEICLERICHSYDGAYIVFVTTNPNIRYIVELKTDKVARKTFVNEWHEVIEWLN